MGAQAGWPKAMFHAETGEERIFQSADDVAEGFITRDEYEDAKAADPALAGANPNKGLAKKHGLTKKEMVAAFAEHEVDHDPKASADDLAALFLDTFSTDEDGDEDEDLDED